MINSLVRDVIKIFNVNKFVETGILEGDTFITVVDWFSGLYKDKFITEIYKHGETLKTQYNIYEIDINPQTMDVVNRVRQKNKNIIPICGNSSEVLGKLIDENAFGPSDSCLFYLDAHTAGVSQPLLEEIAQLKRLEFPIIVVIDDWDVPSRHEHGYSDMYGIDLIRDHIKDKTDVIYETRIPNIHSKQSCFIFFGYNRKQLSLILKHLPLIETLL